MNILFVCKHNRFRSKVSEAFFKKFNKNKKYKIKTAGIIVGNPISKELKKIVRNYGIKLKSKPRPITSKLLKWQDKIIIVADNVPKSFFKNKKVEVWKIRDAGIKEKRKIKKSILQIENKVKRLVRGFN